MGDGDERGEGGGGGEGVKEDQVGGRREAPPRPGGELFTKTSGRGSSR